MYRYLFFIVCLALISALFFLNINNKSRVIEIGNIRIDKNPYKIISGDSVNKMLKLEINSNKIKFKRDLNLKEIENKLNQNSLIEDLQIFVTIKGEVRTIVKPKMPILSVHGLEKYFLDKHGKQFPISIDKNYSEIPLVFGKFKSQEHYDLVNAINKIYKDKFMLNHIKNFFFTNDGLFFKTFSNNYDVKIGSFDAIEKKINNYKVFYAKMKDSSLIEEYYKVNLQFINQVICSK